MSGQYAYLNIDQLKQSYTISKSSHCCPVSIPSEANVKKPPSKIQRSTQLLRKQHASSSQTSFKVDQKPRSLHSSLPRKKRVNTHQMLQSISDIIQKQQKNHKDSQYKYGKKKKRTSQRLFIDQVQPQLKTKLQEKNYEYRRPKYYLIEGKQLPKQLGPLKNFKRKTLHYQQRQIFAHNSKPEGIHMHTEPIQHQMNFDLLSGSNYNQSQLLKGTQVQTQSHDKTFMISKCRKESVLRAKVKHLFKKKYVKTQKSSIQQSKHTIEEGLNVGPWQIQENG